MSGLSSSRLIVVSFRLPFVTYRKDNGQVGRTESRDEMMRAISHVVLQSEGEWVGWPGLALQKVMMMMMTMIMLMMMMSRASLSLLPILARRPRPPV